MGEGTPKGLRKSGPAKAEGAPDGLRFELLGPLRALRDGVEVPLGPPKQRAVLAVLLLQEGRSISYDALVEAVWGGAPPLHVRNLVQKYVSGLRRALGGAAELAWTGSGYRLTGADADDLRERRRWVDEALAARDAGELRRAGELVERAEELWRGEFAEGLRAPYLAAERLRWAEKRLTVLEARLAGEIELGRSFEYVHELVRLVAAHPLRERLVELLMLALYRTGRSSDALTAYEAARQRLAEALGADPGPPLRSLHARMLRQDPALLPRPPVPVS
ncbi:AfsR/SARP family transcriptional regulator [Streptomyces phaeochromogenes]|uniref:AfsR/SARP family transcriptional regulator n=1 Tax=Streptomyces phaeochromogenes TaxID=1923 RepID=UPI0006E3BA3C|nr:AfsR/SARP family transcriptional regulator [Streptomyces phaeochromogenes]WSS98140.1 AfsR/SARP family transcriptional regulator [Streptomyces phaeochromogenes]WTA08665.1 AfsR/SARP family transcriptional regulator [Streptomyces phaeochromogenes]